MSNLLVHTIASTTYVLLLLMFLWMRRIPRTNPGGGWWALAIGFALSGRLSFFILQPYFSQHFTIVIYSAINLIEKPMLLVGLLRFFDLKPDVRWLWPSVVIAEAWLMFCELAGISSILRGSVFCLFNAGYTLYIAGIAYRMRAEVPLYMMWFTAIASALLGLHWMTVTPIIRVVPEWLNVGFMLGIVLALIQYMSLMAAMLLLFQQRLVAAEARALEMAFHDPLTGLNNKRYMHTLFDQVLRLATRPHHLLAVIYIDLDNFKPINDSAGHQAGDEVLKEVARRLRANTRSTDICARIGGDEFIIIATQLEHPERAGEIADKLLPHLTREISVAGQTHTLGASIGISLYPTHGNDLAVLIENADQAMYHVKRSGKNGYCVYSRPDAGENPESTESSARWKTPEQARQAQ